MMTKLVLTALALSLLAGCATRIYPKDETIAPPSVKLGSFSTVVVKPIVVEKVDGDDQDGIRIIEFALFNCLKPIFPTLALAAAGHTAFPPGALVIEPAIEDMKRITPLQRQIGVVGSSAVLLRTRYTDAASAEVIASPVFYANSGSSAGYYSKGAEDRAMLNRVAGTACAYAKANH